MQGHDNDAAQSGGSNNSGASAPEGGIFSSPSLTINTENLPKEFTSGTVQFGATSDASPASAGAQPFSFSETASPSPSGATPLTPRSNTFNSSATGDIKLKPSGKKKSKLPVFIAVFVLVAAIGTGAFFLLRGVGGDGATETSRSEVRTVIWRFNSDYYEDLLTYYNNLIGYTPSLSMNNEYTLLFPVRQGTIVQLLSLSNAATASFKEVAERDDLSALTKSQRDTFNSMVDNTQAALTKINDNISLLNNFYEAFISPIMAMYTSTESTSVACEKTPDMTELLDDNRQSVVYAAELYYSLLCKVSTIEIDASGEEGLEQLQQLQHQTYENANAAAEALSKCLFIIDMAEKSQQEINSLLEELL